MRVSYYMHGVVTSIPLINCILRRLSSDAAAAVRSSNEALTLVVARLL